MRFLRHIGCLVLLLTLAAGTARAQQVETHTVKAGDTLFSLSQQYDTSVDRLRQLNGLTSNVIKVGQTLIVGYQEDVQPASTPAPPDTQQTAASPPPLDSTQTGRFYAARAGDTFYSIANRYGLRADSLFLLNNRTTAPLSAGQRIRLPQRQESTIHRVRSGETLIRIASSYKVSLQALRRANNLEGSTIYTGQELRIPSRTTRPERPRSVLPPPDTTGLVLSYPETFAGRLTASGETYDPEQFTASHSTLPLGTVVLLTNPQTQRHTFAAVNDRGPVDEEYLMEVSEAVRRQLGLEKGSRQPVEIRVVR